jgi:hypothetical protein
MIENDFKKMIEKLGAQKTIKLTAEWLETLGPSEFEEARKAAARRVRRAAEQLFDDSLLTIPEMEKALSAGSWLEIEGVEEGFNLQDTVDGALHAALSVCDCDDPQATELMKLLRHIEIVEAPSCSNSQCGEEAHGLNNMGKPQCETHLLGKETEL